MYCLLALVLPGMTPNGVTLGGLRGKKWTTTICFSERLGEFFPRSLDGHSWDEKAPEAFRKCLCNYKSSPQGGKTALANFLADSTENPISGTYRPTHALRILEFESSNLNVNNRFARAEVELWDMSGDASFESCWSAVKRDAHGVVFVFDPASEEQAKQLEHFHDYFVEQGGGVAESQCVVFASCRDGARIARGAKLASQFNRIPQLQINIAEEANRVRSDFNTFLASILSNLSERSDQEEMSIMNMKN